MVNDISKSPCKADIIRKLADHFPNLDVSALDLITHLHSVSKAISSRINSDLEQYNLSESRMFVLAYIFIQNAEGQAISPSDIAEQLDVTRATVTSLLDGLEETGYITRTHESADRRALTLRITDKGRNFMDNFFNHETLSLPAAVAFLSEEQRQTMLQWLSEISARLLPPVE